MLCVLLEEAVIARVAAAEAVLVVALMGRGMALYLATETGANILIPILYIP